METRATLARVPYRPFVLAAAAVSVLALALTGWYALARGSEGRSAGSDRPLATPVVNYGPIGPDAQTRDLEQRISRIREDTSHGH